MKIKTMRKFDLIPVVTLGVSILTALGLWFWIPIYIFVSFPVNFSGAAIIILGLFITNHSLYQLVRNKTGIRPGDSPSTLVTRGLFVYSRNPIYLGHAVIIAGVCVLTGSVSSFASVPIYLLVLDLFVIPKEEAILLKQFGEEYDAYTKSTHRWMWGLPRWFSRNLPSNLEK